MVRSQHGAIQAPSKILDLYDLSRILLEKSEFFLPPQRAARPGQSEWTQRIGDSDTAIADSRVSWHRANSFRPSAYRLCSRCTAGTRWNKCYSHTDRGCARNSGR